MAGEKTSASANAYLARLRERVGPYTPSDEERLLTFRKAYYGPDAFQAQLPHLAWTLAQPDADAERFPIHVYRDETGIGGQQSRFFTQVRVGPRVVPGAWLDELMVSAAGRMRGVGSVLTKYAEERQALCMALQVTADARKMLRRAGWDDFGEVPLHVRPLCAEFLRRKLPSPANRLARPIDAALLAMELAWRVGSRAAGLALEEVEAFDDRSDVLWRSIGPRYPVACRRDRAFLDWRFVRYPMPGRYRLFYLMRGARPAAHLVLRLEDQADLRVGHLVDYLCVPRETPIVLAAAAGVLRREGARAAYCFGLTPAAGWAFPAAGFQRRSSGWPFMVKLDEVGPEDREAMRDVRNWFLTAGDSLVDLPREKNVYVDAPRPP